MSQQELERPGYLALYKPRRSSLAFIVEALVLLVFLIGSLAIIAQLFAASANKATQSSQLEQAVILASNTAEQFSADPKNVKETAMSNGLAVTCTVNETSLSHGTRYDALIVVFNESGEVYRLNTVRYVPHEYTGVTAGSAAAAQPDAGVGAQPSGQSPANNASGAGTGSSTAGAPVEEVIE